MGLRSGIFNSVNRDRVYKAEDFASYFATFIGNGVFPNPSTGFQVTESNGMNIILKAGKAWINGYYIVNDSDFNMTIDIADGVLKRIDRIVLRLNHIDRIITPVIKKGIFASVPVAPAIQRDADAYEIALADVYVANGVIGVIQGNITDQRLNIALCGIVHGTVNQVDTSTVFNQYQSWFSDYSVTKASEFLTWQTNVTSALEEWIEAQQLDFLAWRQAEETLYHSWLDARKQGFDSWFTTIKNILDTNAAGNLYQMIDEHKESSMPHKFIVGQTVYKHGFVFNPDLRCVSFIYEEV